MSSQRRSVLFVLLVSVLSLGSLTLVSAELPDALTQRLEARQAIFANQVTNERLAKLADHCDEAQLKIGSISTLQSEQRRRREAAYGDVIAQLHRLDGKLTANQVQHDGLRKELRKLDVSWRAFQSASEGYATALSDGRSLDCSTAASGFIVTLVDARQYQISTLESHDHFLDQLAVVKKELNKLLPLLGDKDVLSEMVGLS